MPELPEVEVVKIFLEDKLLNKKITFMKAFSNSKSYFLPILSLKIATFLIYMIPLLILILPSPSVRTALAIAVFFFPDAIILICAIL